MSVLEGVMEGLSACECPVCFLFLSEERLPMSMPCGHTLCKVCVDELASHSRATMDSRGHRPRPTFPCPICRQWVNIDSVSLNVTLRDLLSELTRLQGKKSVPVGTSLNVNYSEIELGEPLDRGAFGEVYRARWKGDSVAVKLFAIGQMTPEALQAFQREVFVMNCLRHPNVVLLMGACQTPPRLAIIMEYVAGGSLHKVVHIDKVQLSIDQVAQLGVDICRGLQYLHSINIMHRDLKSKNVLLTGRLPCSAKLCDFGLARMRQESATMTGNVGTVHWTAPEILNNSRYQFPADVYSFGMVLYEMVCGHIPFQSMIPMAVMVAVVVNRKQPDFPATAHPTLAELIRECIQWEPDGRPSIAKILSSLSALLPPQPVPNSKSSPHRPKLTQQDSLGVVFVSVSDSADLGGQGQDLKRLLQGMENEQMLYGDNEDDEVMFEEVLSPVQSPGPEREAEALDMVLAQRLQYEAHQQQIESDQQLAQQLQLREHSFLAPKDTVQTTATPPQPLLQSIKSGKVPQLKPVARSKKKAATHPVASQKTRLRSSPSPPSTDEDRQEQGKAKRLVSKLSDYSKMAASHISRKEHQTEPAPSKSFQSQRPKALPESSALKKKSAPAAKSSLHSSSVSTKTASKSPTASNYPRTSKFSSALKSGAKKKTASSAVPVPPPPPPVPPVPSRAHNPWHTPRQQMLKQVRMLAPVVGKSLRPVDTVEKRAFRVGRVVGDHNPSLADYSLSKLIPSFSRRYLRHVEVVEPPPAYPVGKVVHNHMGKVKRMSSLLNATPDPPKQARSLSHHNSDPGTGAPPRKRLHPSIQAAIADFKQTWLHHVTPEVKDHLPSRDAIAIEKKRLPADICESIQQFDHAWLHPVEPVVKNTIPTDEMLEVERTMLNLSTVLEDIEAFDQSQLRVVETEVKNVLPSRETLELERTVLGLATAHAEAFDQSQLQDVETEVKNTLPTRETHEVERTTLGFNTVLEDIEAFDQSQLRDVETEVKNTLPTRETILQERKWHLLTSQDSGDKVTEKDGPEQGRDNRVLERETSWGVEQDMGDTLQPQVHCTIS